MDLSTQIGIIYKIKPREAVPLKLREKFLTSLTKLLYLKWKPVSALQSNEIYFYIVAGFQCLLSFT